MTVQFNKDKRVISPSLILDFVEGCKDDGLEVIARRPTKSLLIGATCTGMLHWSSRHPSGLEQKSNKKSQADGNG